MEVIEPIDHHHLLIVIVQLAALLLVARVLGELFSSRGQPAVVGELLAGVLLGPSILGLVAPGVFETLFVVPEEQFHLLEIVSWLGLIMLLIVTGLETDIDLIVSKGRTAIILSLGGILVPFATGFALGWYLPVAFIANPDQQIVFSLFIATAMSISAIPVIAKVLIELDVVRRDIGQLILAAGMVDDTIGWILLSTVVALERSGGVNLGSLGATILSVIVFLGLAFTVGRRLVQWLFRWVDNAVGGEMAMLTTLMVLALSAGAVTQYMGLEAILGAFVVGVLVSQVKRFDYDLRHTFEVMTLAIFAPLFFAIAGLRMNVAALFDPTVFAVGLVVLGVACFGKFVGIMSVARLAGLSRWEGVTIGGGMNARGAMEIIVATIGYGAGVLTIEMYSIIVMVAIVTSLMAPATMRWSIPKIEMSDEEHERMEREARTSRSFVAGITRILLPTRGGADTQYAARLLGPLIRDRDVDLTTMYVADGGAAAGDDRRRLPGPLDRLVRGTNGRETDRSSTANEPTESSSWGSTDGGEVTAAGDTASPERRAGNALERDAEGDGEGGDVAERTFELIERQLGEQARSPRTLVREREESVADTILDEAVDYDLLVLGEAGRGSDPDEPLFSETVDRVIQEASRPTMVVSTPYSGETALEETDESLRRILLPTVGTEYNRHAAELASHIAMRENAIVEIVHVVNEPQLDDQFVDGPDLSNAIEIGEEIVDREAELGRQIGAEVVTTVRVADEPEAEIVDLANQDDVDVIFMSSNLRPLTQRAFYGHRVEHVIQNAPCPVVVLSSV